MACYCPVVINQGTNTRGGSRRARPSKTLLVEATGRGLMTVAVVHLFSTFRGGLALRGRLLHVQRITTGSGWLDEHRSSPQGTPQSSPSPNSSQLSARLRRILFRSRQRGWLELDVVLGRWAARNVSRLTESEVTQLERLLEAETPELYKWISSASPEVPTSYDNEILRQIRTFTLEGGASGAQDDL